LVPKKVGEFAFLIAETVNPQGDAVPSSVLPVPLAGQQHFWHQERDVCATLKGVQCTAAVITMYGLPLQFVEEGKCVDISSLSPSSFRTIYLLPSRVTFILMKKVGRATPKECQQLRGFKTLPPLRI